jgi:hypothetical protein
MCRPYDGNTFSNVTSEFSVQGFMNSEYLRLSCLDANEVSNKTFYPVCMVQHIKIGT